MLQALSGHTQLPVGAEKNSLEQAAKTPHGIHATKR
jgi:hypothetical protein